MAKDFAAAWSRLNDITRAMDKMPERLGSDTVDAVLEAALGDATDVLFRARVRSHADALAALECADTMPGLVWAPEILRRARKYLASVAIN